MLLLFLPGIFFKFARDSEGLYGGDSNASKSCGHELKSLNALQDLQIPGLSVLLGDIASFFSSLLLKLCCS